MLKNVYLFLIVHPFDYFQCSIGSIVGSEKGSIGHFLIDLL